MPVDVVDVFYIFSKDEIPPKQSVGMTRSKVMKFKGVSEAAGYSAVRMKGSRSENVLRKKSSKRSKIIS